ncbi:MAG TPA: hypothetical protein VHL78_05550 [Actinomycetota bacterium]|nr:hypothetical protein [Actinomycetota bacterium]
MVEGIDARRAVARWRILLFRIVTAAVAFFFLANIGNALAPWLPEGPPFLGELRFPETHRWHGALPGTVRGLVVTGALVALLWTPRANVLLVQWLAVSLIVGLPIIVPFAGLPALVFVGLPALLVVVTYPWPRALLDVSTDRLSPVLLVLAAAATALLAPIMWREFGWQVAGVGGEHAATSHWASDVQHAAMLLLGAWLAGTLRPGWRPLAVLLGAAFLYLGVVAVAQPNQAGSWGTSGGILSIIGGVAFVAATIRESGGRPRPTAQREAAPVEERRAG